MSSRGFVLIVDDNRDLRDAMREACADEGYQVSVAANGEEATTFFANGSSPQLVVLDLEMPVMDGWAFRTWLKSRGILVPVILVSAYERIREAAEQLGVEGWLRKPVLPEVLTAEIERLIPRSEPR